MPLRPLRPSCIFKNNGDDIDNGDNSDSWKSILIRISETCGGSHGLIFAFKTAVLVQIHIFVSTWGVIFHRKNRVAKKFDNFCSKKQTFSYI
jgi:lipopolysaccharide/colanic/teichoic acid biosynthesis glycosyltransferase